MSIEYLKAFAFQQEINEAGQLWVARSINGIVHAQEIDQTGYSLPVWSNRDRVVDYLKNALLVGPRFEPYAILLEDFSNRWLSDQSKGIKELQLNPDGKSSQVLAVTTEEFMAAQAAA